MAKWSLDLTKYAEKQKLKIKDVRKSFVFNLYAAIVERTPVDTGRARGNWQVTTGKASDKVTEDKEQKVRSKSDVPNANNDESYFIANNLPYIETIEYGGYPNPVKKGSWDKNKKAFVKKSANGFSKQAPNGMVGVTVASAEKYLQQAIEENK